MSESVVPDEPVPYRRAEPGAATTPRSLFYWKAVSCFGAGFCTVAAMFAFATGGGVVFGIRDTGLASTWTTTLIWLVVGFFAVCACWACGACFGLGFDERSAACGGALTVGCLFLLEGYVLAVAAVGSRTDPGDAPDKTVVFFFMITTMLIICFLSCCCIALCLLPKARLDTAVDAVNAYRTGDSDDFGARRYLPELDFYEAWRRYVKFGSRSRKRSPCRCSVVNVLKPIGMVFEAAQLITLQFVPSALKAFGYRAARESVGWTQLYILEPEIYERRFTFENIFWMALFVGAMLSLISLAIFIPTVVTTLVDDQISKSNKVTLFRQRVLAPVMAFCYLPIFSVVFRGIACSYVETDEVWLLDATLNLTQLSSTDGGTAMGGGAVGTVLASASGSLLDGYQGSSVQCFARSHLPYLAGSFIVGGFCHALFTQEVLTSRFVKNRDESVQWFPGYLATALQIKLVMAAVVSFFSRSEWISIVTQLVSNVVFLFTNYVYGPTTNTDMNVFRGYVLTFVLWSNICAMVAMVGETDARLPLSMLLVGLAVLVAAYLSTLSFMIWDRKRKHELGTVYELESWSKSSD